MSFSENLHLKNLLRYSFFAAALLMITGCASSPRFVSGRNSAGQGGAVVGRTVVGPGVEEGMASYYADQYNGKPTSNGEIYDMYALTAAHPTHPFNTKVKVTNLENGRSVILRINDRGPFLKDRIIDVSLTAAKQLMMIGTGTAKVRVEVIEWGPTDPKVK